MRPVVEPEQLLTVDALAQQTGMTVRTLRSHASRGLLPPPTLRGRTGYYGPHHAARLNFIRDMQEAGFTLTSIERILAGVPADAGEAMLGIIRGLLAPWGTEVSTVHAKDDLLALFGPESSADDLQALIDLGAAETTPDGMVRVLSPGLLAAGAEAVAAGIPMPGVLAAGRLVADSAHEVAECFVALFRDSVWREFVTDGLPETEWERITNVHRRLQPLAVQAFLSAFQRAMSQSVSEALGEELGAGAQDALDRLLGRPAS